MTRRMRQVLEIMETGRAYIGQAGGNPRIYWLIWKEANGRSQHAELREPTFQGIADRLKEATIKRGRKFPTGTICDRATKVWLLN